MLLTSGIDAFNPDGSSGFAPTAELYDHVNALDATFEGAIGSLEFKNHSAGDGAILNKRFNLVRSNCGYHLFVLKDASDIGEIDELIRSEIFGASSCHVIGVDRDTRRRERDWSARVIR